MQSIFQLALSLGLLFGGGRLAFIKAHDTIRDLAISKIQKGLTPTKKLNDKLWENVK
ncbi:MAG: hypothetical protein HN576_13395 [Bacteriovoracaceae bacterium]|jgi:hypothetical protein|nr:hypothetical protein [Bacteriovoracaceae bacterium]